VRCVFHRDPRSLKVEHRLMPEAGWRAVVRVLRSPLDALACSIYPTSCLLCGLPLPRLILAPICEACWDELAPIPEHICVCCGDSLPVQSGADEHCRRCRLVPPAYVQAAAFCSYHGAMQRALHSFKYRPLRRLRKRLGLMLAQAILKLRAQAPAAMLVVPVPLHRRRLRQRGFNQARDLAAVALQALGKVDATWQLRLAPAALLRPQATLLQAGLTPRQRRLNVARAFAVADPQLVAGQHILLIDDILTTGATAEAAAAALIKAGAASVRVATVARTYRMAGNSAPSDQKQFLAEAHEPGKTVLEEDFFNAHSLHDQPSF